MTFAEYFGILGLPVNSSIDDIKRAYRQKARLYHPDINHSPEAKDMFIRATEAYEFLLTNHHLIYKNDEGFSQAMEDWRKYRQTSSQRRANAYARASYIRFKKTKFYKTTRILDGTSLIFSLIVSTCIVIYTIAGYIYRINHPLPDTENPSILIFLLLLLIGMIFFLLSVIYLKAFMETSRKRRKNPK